MTDTNFSPYKCTHFSFQKLLHNNSCLSIALRDGVTKLRLFSGLYHFGQCAGSRRKVLTAPCELPADIFVISNENNQQRNLCRQQIWPCVGLGGINMASRAWQRWMGLAFQQPHLGNMDNSCLKVHLSLKCKWKLPENDVSTLLLYHFFRVWGITFLTVDFILSVKQIWNIFFLLKRKAFCLNDLDLNELQMRQRYSKIYK